MRLANPGFVRIEERDLEEGGFLSTRSIGCASRSHPSRLPQIFAVQSTQVDLPNTS